MSPKLTLRIAEITELTAKRVKEGRFTSSIGVSTIQIQGEIVSSLLSRLNSRWKTSRPFEVLCVYMSDYALPERSTPSPPATIRPDCVSKTLQAGGFRLQTKGAGSFQAIG